MVTSYTVDFTDQVRSFQLAPYTTNGPINPIDGSLGTSASAATTLFLYGKGSPDFGERLQENMVHQLENFNSSTEPVYPIGGQLWFDRSAGADGQLRVFNQFKHEILVDVDNVGNAFWALASTDSAEETEMLARFLANFRVRIFNDSTSINEDYIICANAIVNSGSNVAFQVMPVPSTTRATGAWYVGGWEYVLQNDSPLGENWLVNQGVGSPAPRPFTLRNLGDPALDFDAATKKYVDEEIFAAAFGGGINLDGAADVIYSGGGAGSPTTPNEDDLLVFISGSWRNTAPASAPVLALTGGTLTGFLTLDYPGGGSPPGPILGTHAATKAYVDSVVGVNTLSGLLDTSISFGSPTPPASVLVHNGVTWVNQSNTSFITANSLFLTTGGTITGSTTFIAPLVDMSSSTQVLVPTINTGSPFGTGSPTAPDNTAATKRYVDDAVVAGQDGVVDSGLFNTISKDLTLFRTEGLSDIVVSLIGAGGDSNDIIHTIDNPNSNATLSEGRPGLAWERLFYDEATYPDVDLKTMLTHLNERLGRLLPPKGRIVFEHDGVNTLVNLSDASGSPTYAQCNTLLPTGTSVIPPYTVGSNRLSVYVNGIKYISSDHGFRRISATGTPGSPDNQLQVLNEGTFTGLNTAFGSPTGGGSPPVSLITYSFQISVNSNSFVQINVPGSQAAKIGNVIDVINSIADANYTTPELANPGSGDIQYAFGAVAYDGSIFIYSSIPGDNGSPPSTSKIDLIDGPSGGSPPPGGSPSNPALFASMTGTVGSPTTTLPFAVVLPLSLGTENGYTPTPYGYKEIGRVGLESFLFEFTEVLTAGAVVEVIVEPDMFGDRLP